MAKQQKAIAVLARYEHKRLANTVTYVCASTSSDAQHTTTVVNGKASACSCAGNAVWYKKCHHMTHCEKLEAARSKPVVEKTAQPSMMNATLAGTRAFSILR